MSECNAKFKDGQMVVYKGDPRGTVERGFPVQIGERVRVLDHMHSAGADPGLFDNGRRPFPGVYYRLSHDWLVSELCLEAVPPGWDGKQLFTDGLKPAEITLDQVMTKAMEPNAAAVPENDVDRIFNALFGKTALGGDRPKYDVKVFQVPLNGRGAPDMDAVMRNIQRLLDQRAQRRGDKDEL